MVKIPHTYHRTPPRIAKALARLPAELRPTYGGVVEFGPSLLVERFTLPNGLALLCCEDPSAPVLSFHTWLRVGSRHEVPGKTGLAHLFEHLMFGETQSLGPGAYDHQLEEAGAETNASTWLDFTQFTVNAPANALPLVVELESERLLHLALTEKQVATEKDVVANERRYRVDDDIEGATSELLWSTAFTKHSYQWPTIGWMADIQSFTPADCAEFYRTFYAPNNATLVVVGDFKLSALLERISKAYGRLTPSVMRIEDVTPESAQLAERRLTVEKPTPTEKAVIGYRGPALGDFDHIAVGVLAEVLCGGRPSRLMRRLVHELELAADVRVFVGPFRDPGLIEVSITARDNHTAEELLAVLDEEIALVCQTPVSDEELERALNRIELGLLASLDTVDGKASTIGFYETLLGRPAAAFERLESMRRCDPNDLLRAARRFLRPEGRSVIFVRRSPPSAKTSPDPQDPQNTGTEATS